jgi:SAM-dependent methyltransferase
MIDRLDVPRELHRNAPGVVAAGYEHTGQLLINLATRSVGLENLKDVNVLDVGCGVRFTMTIINRKIPIKSYTGLEVSRPIAEFLQNNVEPYDKRFKFVHWNVHNQMYNPGGVELATQKELPVEGSFDLIWLFSVFTHMNPKDSLSLLQLLRKQICKNGKLFFSAFIDDELDGFEDRVKDRPLFNAYYGRKYMQSLIDQSGWKIQLFHDKDLSNYIQHYIVCSPD